MSHPVNDMLLEKYFEEGLEMGLTEAQAEAYANEKLEQGS